MENNQPAPSRTSKRIKLARAAQEKLRPRSNESLAALPTKSAFIQSVVSALPSRDESFFSEGTTRHGPVAKQVRGKGGERGDGNGDTKEQKKVNNSRLF